MITTHTQLLNALIEKYNLKSYLEIGINNPDGNYNKITLPIEYKVGVDPCLDVYGLVGNLLPIESDTFFAHQKDKFDLIFLDGLHHADQVKRDFENSLRCLNDNGFIVIHDVLPDEEQYTTVPRQTKRWFGTVYQFAMSIGQYNGIQFVTYNIDCGCMVVAKNPNRIATLVADKYDWETYTTIGHRLMNITNEVII